MSEQYLRIRPEDLDEAAIYFYRFWSFIMLGEEPEALVILEPEYIVISRDWVLYCNRTGVDNTQLSLLASDLHKPIICASTNLRTDHIGLNVETGLFHGPEKYKLIVETLARAAEELPSAARSRDPTKGRWITKSTGKFEIWQGKQARLLCFGLSQDIFGYTWDYSQSDVFFYRSKSCKQEGHILLAGHYKYSEQKREHGVLHKNIDLISIENREAALLHLTPSGAGYKVFPRKLPESFMPISYFYDIG